jgi:hypothetical protein
MISLAEKTIEEINDVVRKGSVLIFTASFDGVINENSRHYLVVKKKLYRNKRYYNLSLYEIGEAHQICRDYDTYCLLQHRSHYHIIP